MTAESRYDLNAIAYSPQTHESRRRPRRRLARLPHPPHHAHNIHAHSSGLVVHERPSQRLRRILTSNPRARHFTVRRIIVALGEPPQGPALALFSAAGVFEAPDVGHLSGVVTGAVGAQLVLRQREVSIPRAVLNKKIPRHSLVTLIDAVANLLERAEAAVRPRWDWVFHPGVGVALGVVLLLLGVASMIPILKLSVDTHAFSAFVMSIGFAERDGLLVLVGVGAGIASLAVAVANTMSGRQILATTRSWLVQCVRRLRIQFAAWFLDRIEKGLGDLLRIDWSNVFLLFFSVFAGRIEEPAMAGARADRSLKARAERVRLAVSQRGYDGKGAK